jgi:ABC-type Mn2+/Zn2+ transport system ATPase subunit
MTNPVFIDIEGLRVSLDGRPVLTNVNVQIRAGLRTAIVGPNGGGKTTLMRTLLGFLKPDRGNIRFRDTYGEETERPRIGYLPQRSTLASDAPVSALDVVLLSLFPQAGWPVRMRSLPEVNEALERAGLPPRLINLPVGRLSGGERQRVLLARTLAGSPPIMILDEPDTALDAGGLRTLRRLIAEEVERGKAVVYVTHDSNAMGGADVIYRIDGTATLEEAG